MYTLYVSRIKTSLLSCDQISLFMLHSGEMLLCVQPLFTILRGKEENKLCRQLCRVKTLFLLHIGEKCIDQSMWKLGPNSSELLRNEKVRVSIFGLWHTMLKVKLDNLTAHFFAPPTASTCLFSAHPLSLSLSRSTTHSLCTELFLKIATLLSLHHFQN